MGIIEDLRKHPFCEDDHLLLDTNIWLFTYGTTSHRYQPQASTYNRALNEMKKNNSHLYISPSIISEFINQFVHVEWQINGKQNQNKKSYRNSLEFKPVAKEIVFYLKEILKLSDCSDALIDSGKANDLLNEYEGCSLDFNDIIIEDVCKSNDLTLVTDDRDFKNCPIPVLTANPTLLR